MNLPFRKSSAADVLASDAAKLRQRRDDVARQLDEARNAIVAKTANAEKLLIDEADATALAKAESAIRDAETALRTRTGALAQIEQQIAEIEHQIAALANQKQRKQVAAEIEAVRREIGPAGAAAIEGLLKLAAVAQRTGRIVNDGTGLAIVSERFATDLPAALDLIETLLKSHIEAVLAGSASSVIRQPEAAPTPAPPPEPKTTVLTMVPIRWRERGDEQRSARYQQASLPVAVAARLLKSGHVIEMGSQRARSLYSGFVAAPASADCIDIDDSHLKPLKPIFDPDRLKAEARFEEVRGGHQSWINAERG
jgi:hypothetical protein